MSGYIRIDKEQPTDPRLGDMADKLASRWQVVLVNGLAGDHLSSTENRHALRHALFGALVTLWCYADTHIRRDNSLPVTLSGLATLIGLPVTLLKDFADCWLVEREDGRVVLPGYCEKNGITPKDLRKVKNDVVRANRREKDRIRQQRHRQKTRGTRHGVTSRKNGRDSGRDSHDTGTGTGTPDPTSTVPSSAPLAASPERAAAARENLRQLTDSMRATPAPAKRP